MDDANWITADGEQPHKVSGLVPTANGAVNDLDPGPPYQIDADVARWLFESADLGNDAKGNADLSAYGSPATDSSDYRQGSSSVHLVRASSQYFKVLDSALPSNFPLKGGTANRVFTLCFWFKADTIPGSGVYQKIFAKENYGTDNCFEAWTLKLTASFGDSGGPRQPPLPHLGCFYPHGGQVVFRGLQDSRRQPHLVGSGL